MNVPFWITIGFQQRDRRKSQNLNIDTLCRLPVTCVQCVIETEIDTDAGRLLYYDIMTMMVLVRVMPKLRKLLDNR